MNTIALDDHFLIELRRELAVAMIAAGWDQATIRAQLLAIQELISGGVK